MKFDVGVRHVVTVRQAIQYSTQTTVPTTARNELQNHDPLLHHLKIHIAKPYLVEKKMPLY